MQKKKQVNKKWYKGQVIHGSKQGRKIDYPTANIDLKETNLEIDKGVYASWVKIGNKQYQGLLYFGPRLVQGENFDVCEIYILDFDENIYEKELKFQIIDYIRGVMDFKDMQELKAQIDVDLERAHEIFIGKTIMEIYR